jgi:hypothetical protein
VSVSPRHLYGSDLLAVIAGQEGTHSQVSALEADGPSKESLVSSRPFPLENLHALVAATTGGEVLDVSVHDRWRGCEGIKDMHCPT